jgi:outer membrane protein assembly factor BamB
MLAVPTRLLALGLLLLIPFPALGEWPGFRGPEGTGVSTEKGLPVEWGEKENLTWKVKLPGPGSSSPIVWGDRVFVTSYSGYAEGNGDPGDVKNLHRHLVCVDRNKGKIIWSSDVPARQPELDWKRAVQQHGYSTSTPVTDGERVYAFFGKTGVFAYDFDGKQLWHADVGKLLNAFGTGASPALWRNLLLVNAAVEGGGFQALDKCTGKMVWKVKLYDDCWSTPLVVDVPGKEQEVILMTPGLVRGFEPATGKELWRCACEEPDYVSATPLVRAGVVYVMGSGQLGQAVMAVRTGGRGDVSKTHVLWKQDVGASFCSPVLAGPYLYFFSNFAYCLKVDTGEIVFRARLPGLGREYASPVAGDGKIYLFTRRGTGYVLAARDHLEVLARNTLDAANSFVASPAVDRGQIFVRSHNTLYCIGAKRRR